MPNATKNTTKSPNVKPPKAPTAPPLFISPYQKEHWDEIQTLKAAALELVEIAETVKDVSARVSSRLREECTSGLRPWAIPATVKRLGAYRPLLTVLFSQKGLGYAFDNSLVQGLGRTIGKDNLHTDVMVASLKLRLEAVWRAHPELEGDEKLRNFFEAVYEDRDLEAMRALRVLLRDRGTIGGLSKLAPMLNEIFSLKALRDENPLNDTGAWEVATGKGPARSEMLFGIPSFVLSRWDKGDGAALPIDASAFDKAVLETEGSFLGFTRNINVLGNDGRVLIQTIEGSDGVERYVVQSPGARPGELWNNSPQDVSGAFRAVLDGRCSYRGALMSAIEQYGIPHGSQILLIGHSLGGITSMLLAEDAEFCERYRLTHVISFGSAISHRRPADERTRVVSVVNQHDLFPAGDGIGAGSCFPVPAGWYVVDYTLPTHQFPECHSPTHYLNDLETLLDEPRKYIDELIADYHGTVVRSQLYQTHDELPRPPAYPFLSVRSRREGATGLPLTCSDGDSLVAVFGADADPAKEIFHGVPGGQPLWVGPGRVLVALLAVTCRDGSQGPYRQIAIGPLVRGPWSRNPLPLSDLLRRGDLREMGISPVHVLTDRDDIAAANQDTWGVATETADVAVEIGRARMSIRAGDHGGRLLRLQGLLGPAIPTPARDLVLYAKQDRRACRIHLQAHGWAWTGIAPTARLKLGASHHPLIRQLTRLGLNGRRPLAAITSRGLQYRIDAGAPLHFMPELDA